MKKLFIKDLEKRQSTSPLFATTQALGEEGRGPVDREGKGGTDPKKLEDLEKKQQGVIDRNNKTLQEGYRVTTQAIGEEGKGPKPGPTTQAIGEEGKGPKPKPGPIYILPVKPKPTTQAIGEEGKGPKPEPGPIYILPVKPKK